MTPEELHHIYRSEEDFWWYRGMRAIMDVFLEPLRKEDISLGLDAGCGTGFNALDLERRYGTRMYGIDLARIGIAYCRERGLTRSAVGSLVTLPFASNRFDLVVSFDVLSHLRPGDDDLALRELVRTLRPNGWLLLRVPAFHILRSRHSQFIAEFHRYTAPEMAAKLAALGCPAKRWTYANCLLSPVALLKFRVWENLRRMPAASGVEELPPAWLNHSLLAMLKFEAALFRAGIRFRFGQSLIVCGRKTASEKPFVNHQ